MGRPDLRERGGEGRESELEASERRTNGEASPDLRIENPDIGSHVLEETSVLESHELGVGSEEEKSKLGSAEMVFAVTRKGGLREGRRAEFRIELTFPSKIRRERGT